MIWAGESEKACCRYVTSHQASLVDSVSEAFPRRIGRYESVHSWKGTGDHEAESVTGTKEIGPIELVVVMIMIVIMI